ncbi:unnamed protein product [Ambrosiozyma monospora]|uniref:Unnamed protein product n=1 Tax=Ambrosiozyma monospora TaxID=43982 RepID=A0A9W6YSC2_AMBMO|nr:unnamed protein product [Ambrosiozyma monospora]
MSDPEQMKRRMAELQNSLKLQKEQLAYQLALKELQIKQQQQNLHKQMKTQNNTTIRTTVTKSLTTSTKPAPYPYPFTAAKGGIRSNQGGRGGNYRGGYKGFVGRVNISHSHSPSPSPSPVSSANSSHNNSSSNLNGNSNDNSTFVKTKHGLVNTSVYDTNFKKKLREQKYIQQLKKDLHKHVFENRSTYEYKNHILIDNLKFVLVDAGNTLALISVQFEDTQKEIMSVDDLKVMVAFEGRKYIKSYTGDFHLQRFKGSYVILFLQIIINI